MVFCRTNRARSGTAAVVPTSPATQPSWRIRTTRAARVSTDSSPIPQASRACPPTSRSTMWLTVCTVLVTRNPASTTAAASAQAAASSSVTPMPSWNAPASCRKCRRYGKPANPANERGATSPQRPAATDGPQVRADQLRTGVHPRPTPDPPRAVLCEQRRETVVVTHHHRVGELTAQRLDLHAISDGLKVAHRFLPRLRCGTCTTDGPPKRFPEPCAAAAAEVKATAHRGVPATNQRARGPGPTAGDGHRVNPTVRIVWECSGRRRATTLRRGAPERTAPSRRTDRSHRRRVRRALRRSRAPRVAPVPPPYREPARELARPRSARPGRPWPAASTGHGWREAP